MHPNNNNNPPNSDLRDFALPSDLFFCFITTRAPPYATKGTPTKLPPFLSVRVRVRAEGKSEGWAGLGRS